MNATHARGLLDRIEVLRHPSDVDLLIFFARHPRALMASEQLLATLLGYDIKQIAESLDVLLKAGFLRRIPSRAHAARMYVFDASGTNEGLLPPFVELACTREGRLAIRQALKFRPASGEEVEKDG